MRPGDARPIGSCHAFTRRRSACPPTGPSAVATHLYPSTLSPLLLCHRLLLSFSSPMAQRYPSDGAAAKGFGRRHLRKDEAHLLYEAEYPAPQDMRVSGAWRLSTGGVLVPSPPTGAERQAEIACIRSALQENSRNLLRYALIAMRSRRHSLTIVTPTSSPPPTGSSMATGTNSEGLLAFDLVYQITQQLAMHVQESRHTSWWMDPLELA
ncbi:hypothetical protein D1007_48682 [Hordeum vulgare]|nr:hypothetical protein D1007_48682 [Hordeum vulgare]